MRRAHYAVVCGVAAVACGAYVLGSGGRGGDRTGAEWFAPVGADADGNARGGGAKSGAADALVLRLVGERYGVPDPVLAQATRDGLTPAEVALASNLAARSGRPLAVIQGYRKAGEGWESIGRRFGLKPAMLSDPVLPPLAASDEALFRDVLRRDYRLSDLAAARLRREGFSAGDILVAAALTGGGEAEVAEALFARRQGQGWQAATSRSVGRRMGAAPDAGGPASPREGGAPPGERVGSAEAAPYVRALLADRYGIGSKEVEAAAARGLPWMDLLIAANAASRSGSPFLQVVGLRGEGLSWQAVEKRVGLGAGDAFRLPAPAARRASRPGEERSTSGNGKAAGAGLGPGSGRKGGSR